jgi:DNA adenine methylase
MAYVGGKSKCSKFIIDILNDASFDGMNYIEPFVGYCHILRRVKNKKSYIGYDNNKLLITLLNGVQNHKQIPKITREKYYTLKKTKKNTFERSVACFAYSYNGKAWGGYTISSKDGSRNYIKERTNYYKKLQQNKTFMNTDFVCADYKQLNPMNSLIYCDPPYNNTTGYGENFDSDEFWDLMRDWSINNTVFISEYASPEDFICLGYHTKRSTLGGNRKQSVRVEKLFVKKVS